MTATTATTASTASILERLSLRRLLQCALASAMVGVMTLSAVSLYEAYQGNKLAHAMAADVRMARAAAWWT